MPMQFWNGLDALPTEPLEPVATLGNFDGVHRGHAAILGRLHDEAARVEAPTMVITFHPHPREVLRPGVPFEPIMSLKERLRCLWELGVDHVLVIPFDQDFSEVTASQFVREVLWERLHVRAMYVGWNMMFGHGREGDVKFLQSEGRRLGFSVGVVDPVLVGSKPISSSWVRETIVAGDLETATRLLGRHHKVVGKVVPGDGRGREIGVPTANLETDGGLLPPPGVYAARALLPDESRRHAVVNVGVRPTFGEGGPLRVEAHVLDFAGDLYGSDVHLGMVKKIREEMRFDGVPALKRQIKEDVAEARKILGA